MKLITVSGPPSSGKTSVITWVIEQLGKETSKVVKFDCLSSMDKQLYLNKGIEAKVGLSGNQCPDHFYISNIEDCILWAKKKQSRYLIIESAGLCNRCAPHLKEYLAVCVIDNLSGINTPHKIGPMLKQADIVVITKGDIVSQAEREVFAYKVKQVNAKANIVFLNGITGQGAFDLSEFFKEAMDLKANGIVDSRLRFSMPAALCSYCLGETRVGEDFLKGNIKKMKWE
ncbi:MAG: GTP-binding protein [Lachnospirales bacterium]